MTEGAVTAQTKYNVQAACGLHTRGFRTPSLSDRSSRWKAE